ncbi:MAG: FliI/YscN family ATPase [Salinispira sp.]
MEHFARYIEKVKSLETIQFIGRVEKVQALLIESVGPPVVIGEICEIELPHGRIFAEAVGLCGKTVQLMPFSACEGVEVGALVRATSESLHVGVSGRMLGRILNALGEPMDDKGPIYAEDFYPVMAHSPDILNRKNISEQVATGIRAIDGFIPTGKGQRMGIFSGSGVGKSTILGMIARNTSADVNVIALIGERGREVREFIEQDLGEEGLRRSVIVVSSGDTPPAARLKGAYAATAIAEYFRDQGKDVMLLFDSVTRFARAQREIGLATGEAPATRGFPPSTFSVLPALLERCGTSEKGTITGFYSVLVEGDDLDEPISDTIRGILDGHVVLSRHLAQSNHYPAVDILQSVSRLATKISTPEIQRAARYVRGLISLYRDNEDLINIGAYTAGTNPTLDEAIRRNGEFNDFLKQEIAECSTLEETHRALSEMMAGEPAPPAPTHDALRTSALAQESRRKSAPHNVPLTYN